MAGLPCVSNRIIAASNVTVMPPSIPSLITGDELSLQLGNPDWVILDASWYMPAEARDPYQEYLSQHIPGARFFDIESLSDHNNRLPHMLPTIRQFEKGIQGLGISNNNKIVVYDGAGLFSAARAWWMFKVFGHDDVAILDGGFPLWVKERRPTESGEPVVTKPGNFQAAFRAELVKELRDVQAAMKDKTAQIADARSPARFSGEEPEPREGLRSGHIPGSYNLYYKDFLDPKTSTLLPESELRKYLEQTGLEPWLPAICTCGSGITACIPAFVFHLLGENRWSVYDGSWAEWGRSGPDEDKRPIELD